MAAAMTAAPWATGGRSDPAGYGGAYGRYAEPQGYRGCGIVPGLVPEERPTGLIRAAARGSGYTVVPAPAAGKLGLPRAFEGTTAVALRTATGTRRADFGCVEEEGASLDSDRQDEGSQQVGSQKWAAAADTGNVGRRGSGGVAAECAKKGDSKGGETAPFEPREKGESKISDAPRTGKVAAAVPRKGGGAVAAAKSCRAPPDALRFRVTKASGPTRTERAEIMALYREAFREENAAKEKRGLKTTHSMSPEEAFGYIFPGKHLIIATQGERIAGFATVEVSSHSWVRALVVDESIRRQGLGSRLLKKALEVAGSRNVQISYWKGRPPWLGEFYRKAGFREVSVDGQGYVTMNLTN